MALLLRNWIIDCMRSLFTVPLRSRLSTVAFTMSMQNFRMLLGRNLIPVYRSKLFAEKKFSLKLRVQSENKTIIELEKFDIQMLFVGWVWCVNFEFSCCVSTQLTKSHAEIAIMTVKCGKLLRFKPFLEGCQVILHFLNEIFMYLVAIELFFQIFVLIVTHIHI